ncbi:MAG: CoA-binding protein [Phycisphaeraceae bacterium]|nr:CoA-binding protein [Phycisphaeraceae bacterium]
MSTSDLQSRIEGFLSGSPFAVVGASADRAKYGNKVLRCYLQNGRVAIPVNPSAAEIEGLRTFANLRSIPERVHAVSIITPPPVTERIVEEAGELGIKHIWMQPGAESAKAIGQAQESGMNVIASGACVLVVLGFRER